MKVLTFKKDLFMSVISFKNVYTFQYKMTTKRVRTLELLYILSQLKLKHADIT